ncbi:adenosine 5'-monophosphoramidase HINT3-like [Prorops nasuta]|uniref:adenosine 5'-monophosphoramidase HINT3-like n=1 Tax=Prorops nasuta TaxID=863751 RepID=UPI0034CD354D
MIFQIALFRNNTFKKMTEYIKNCIFCKIINDEVPGTKIYEDDSILCIKDINPASTHHYLILPKQHIKNAKELKPEDRELYEKMLSAIDTLAQKQGFDLENTRTGFTWPPFNSVNHLHLHVISPIENLSLIRRIMFKPDSYWFVSTDYVKSRL